MTLVAIFSAVRLVCPLLHILVELNLLFDSFAFLQKFIYLYGLVLAQILPPYLQKIRLVSVVLQLCLGLLNYWLVQHVVVGLVEFVDGLINLVVDSAELTSGLERRTFARGGCGCEGFAGGEELNLLHPTTGPGQIREAAMLLFLSF